VIVCTGSLSRIQNIYVVGVDPVRLDGAQGTGDVSSNMSLVVRDERIKMIASTLLLLISLIGSMIIVSRNNDDVN